MTSVLRKNSSKMATERATIGDTKTSAVSYDHMGWLLCDGRSLSVADYNLLFQVIGYAFTGSTGGTTFKLPDARGRVAASIGQASGTTGNDWNMGDISGQETHTLTIAQMPSHNHGGTTGNTSLDVTQTSVVTNVTANTQQTTASVGLSSSYVTGINVTSVDPSITPNPHNHTIASQGGDDPHNNIQPTIWMGNTFIFCGIFTAGSYPLTNGTNIL